MSWSKPRQSIPGTSKAAYSYEVIRSWWQLSWTLGPLWPFFKARLTALCLLSSPVNVLTLVYPLVAMDKF